MTLLAYDKRFLEHDFSGHPECAERLTSIISHLERSDLWPKLIPVSIREVSDDELALVHTRSHIQSVRSFCEMGGGWFDADTYALASSYFIAKLACGAVLSSIEMITQGKDKTAFCAIRPPGHHATPDRAMGFCLFNNVAVAARFIQKQKWGERVLIVDWDVHHGNGTQDIFWADPTVAYFSAHRYPFYPGTGSMEEIGEGAGEGLTFNLPLGPDFALAKKVELTEKYIRDIAKKVKPDWILISCGFDAYSGDPIGGLGFEAETYAYLTRVVREVAAEFSQGRVVSVLEGGYALEALGKLAEAHIRELI